MKYLSKGSIVLMTSLGLSTAYLANTEMVDTLQVHAQTEAGITLPSIEVGYTKIIGQTKPNAVVTMLHEASTNKFTATADAQGKFIIELDPSIKLAVGDTLNFTANINNNETLTATAKVAQETSVNLTIDPVYSGSNLIKGKATPEATVSILHTASATKVTETADAEGNFTVTFGEITGFEAGDKLNLTGLTQEGKEFTKEILVEADQSSTSTTASQNKAQSYSLASPASLTTVAPTTTTVTTTTNSSQQVPLTINPVYAGSNIVEGKTAPEATLTLMHVKSGLKVTETADLEGNFTLAHTAVGIFSEGDQLNITGTTKDGKTFYKELTVQAGATSDSTTTKEIQTTTASGKELIKHFLKINPVVVSDKLIAGQSSPGATVTVLFERTNDKVTLKADERGDWTIDLSDQGIQLQVEDLIHATSLSTDNQTAAYGVEVRAGLAEDNQHFVKINKILDTDKIVSGTTLPNSTVTVFFDRTKDKETVTADAQGNWSVQVPAEMTLQAGDKVNATSNNNNEGVAFVQTTVTATQTTTVDQSKLPNTGEKSSHSVIVSGLVTFLAGLGLIFKKKQ